MEKNGVAFWQRGLQMGLWVVTRSAEISREEDAQEKAPEPWRNIP